jgi:hypothetical protein
MFIPFIIIGLFIALVGFSMFFPAWNARKHDQIRESWPAAKGTVMSPAVVREVEVTGRGGRRQKLFDVSIKYQFRAGGQLRFGSSVSFRRSLYDAAGVAHVTQQYPAGATVTVHYNPEEPQESYLEMVASRVNKYYRFSMLLIAAALIFVCIGLVMGSIANG